MDEIFSVEKTGDSVDLQTLTQLREQLGDSLRSVDQLRPPPGLATGVDVFDDFLLWKGLPKGDLSLFNGKPGTGATSLWLKTAAQVHRQGKWVAWVNSDWDLMPNALLAKNLRLDRLLVVRKPKEERQLFWILQELISSTLFEMVGCHLPTNNKGEPLLKRHQLQKLKNLARLHQVALVFVSHAGEGVAGHSVQPLFALVIDCGRDFFSVKRALHRPTPFTVSGAMVHPQLGADLTEKLRLLLDTEQRVLS